MKKSNELTLGEAIREFLQLNDLDEKLLETEIYARWEELAGKSINLRTKSVKLHNGVLSVFLNSATLRSELNMRKSGILETINGRLRGKAVLRDIYFK